MNSVHYSSDKTDWETPPALFDELHGEFGFALDVCATAENTKCNAFLGVYQDALTVPWPATMCWMNPPYGRELGKWIQKAWDEKQSRTTTVCLVPARPDTKWWAIFWDHERHHTRSPHDEVRFIKGRIKFEGAKHAAPFPSAIVVLRGANE